MIDVELEEGMNLRRTDETVTKIEDILDEYDEIENYLSTVGSGAQAFMGAGATSNTAEIMVNLVPGAERNISTSEFSESIERDITNTASEADIQISQSAQAGIGGEANTVVFNINDPNKKRLEETSEEIVEKLEEENIIRDVQASIEETSTELQVVIDKGAAQQEGLVPAQIAETVNQITNGQTATTIQTEDQEIYEVIVRYHDETLESQENFERVSIQNQDGEYIVLSDVAKIEEGEGPITINRSDMVESIEFEVTYTSSSHLGEVSTLIEEVIDDIELADEAEFVFGGDQEMMEEAMENLIMALGLGIVIIYLVMTAQFESFKFPFVIMFTVPFFVIGVMLSLVMTQTPVSIMSFMGVIVLAGIVVNNAIVLVDYINKKKEAGMHSYEAIIDGVKDRTRPIIITALTTILGVVPLAIGMGEGTEIQQPIGIVIIGGLISSTLLTLFVIPVIYSLFDPTTRNINKKYMTPDGEIIYARDLMKKDRDNEND